VIEGQLLAGKIARERWSVAGRVAEIGAISPLVCGMKEITIPDGGEEEELVGWVVSSNAPGFKAAGGADIVRGCRWAEFVEEGDERHGGRRV